MATLWWMLHAWRTPEVFHSLGFDPVIAADAEASPCASRSLVPARHEEAVLGMTLDRLAELDYTAFEVLAIVGHDDPGTKLVAEEAAHGIRAGSASSSTIRGRRTSRPR